MWPAGASCLFQVYFYCMVKNCIHAGVGKDMNANVAVFTL